ncbi:MAG TPA: hypothetical protein VK195_05020 [Burkholderiaceae bacterium]|nr:hypothetical protein [Burkholderiaceae bacterium]
MRSRLPALLALPAALLAGSLAWPALAQVDPWAGTAYLKQEVRHSYQGKTYGLARDTMGGLFEQCNAFRASGGLPPVWPPKEVLDGVDVEIVERYYDNGKALTWRRGYGVEPTDLQRWLADSAKAPGKAAPPDCSLYKKTETSSGELWVDGVHYELRRDRKAIASRKHPSLARRALGFRLPDPLPTPTLIHGEGCVKLSGGGGALPHGESCLWTRFPAETYLSWPWMLESRAVVGMGPHPMVTEVRTLDLSHGRPSPKDIFRVPADYVVKGLP